MSVRITIVLDMSGTHTARNAPIGDQYQHAVAHADMLRSMSAAEPNSLMDAEFFGHQLVSVSVEDQVAATLRWACCLRVADGFGDPHAETCPYATPAVFPTDTTSHALHVRDNDPVPWCEQCKGTAGTAP